MLGAYAQALKIQNCCRIFRRGVGRACPPCPSPVTPLYTRTHARTGTVTKTHTLCTKHTCITTITTLSMHARTHTYSTQTSKMLKQKLKADFLCPSNQPNFSLQVSSSSSSLTSTVQSIFMLLTISGETMCGGHQRTLSSKRLPSSHSKPTAVDRQRLLTDQLRKMPPSASKIQQERKELKKES